MSPPRKAYCAVIVLALLVEIFALTKSNYGVMQIMLLPMVLCSLAVAPNRREIKSPKWHLIYIFGFPVFLFLTLTFGPKPHQLESTHGPLHPTLYAIALVLAFAVAVLANWVVKYERVTDTPN